MDRRVLIDAALERRGFSPHLAERLERYLDHPDERARLRCCNSGCFVCVQQIQAILAEVEAAMAAQDEGPR